MIDSIAISGFKCFSNPIFFPLKKITLLYGRNGRGKSSLLQSLLLLSQTFKERKNISALILSSDKGFVNLGVYSDVVYHNNTNASFSFDIESIDRNKQHHRLHARYVKYEDRPTLAKIIELTNDNVNLLGEIAMGDVVNNSDAKREAPYISGSQAQTDIPALIDLNGLRYVSANRVGPINSQRRDDTRDLDDLGNGGEYAINVLGNHKEKFVKEIQKDLSRVLTGASIRTDDTKDPEKFYLFLDSLDNNTNGYKPVNVGFGYSYILPILISLRLATQGNIIIVENPEAHLHPGAQSELMKLIVEMSVRKNLQIILETHSDHVINGMRIAVKKNIISRRDANILHFGRSNDGEPTIEEINVDNNGQLSKYPEDFLDEMTKQLMQLM